MMHAPVCFFPLALPAFPIRLKLLDETSDLLGAMVRQLSSVRSCLSCFLAVFAALSTGLTGAAEVANGPTIALSSTPIPYTVADWPVLVAEAGTLCNCGSQKLSGCVLTLALSDASALDALVIEPCPGSPIKTDGDTVCFEDVVIGTFAAGHGIHPFTAKMNEKATRAGVTALIQALAFSTADENSTNREVRLSLTCNNTASSVSRSIHLNRAPKAANYTILARDGAPVHIPYFTLLASATDPDNDPLNVSDVATVSRSGGQITANGKGLTYTPPAKGLKEDSFAYAVQDGRQGTGVGVVTIVFVKPVNLALNTRN